MWMEDFMARAEVSLIGGQALQTQVGVTLLRVARHCAALGLPVFCQRFLV